MPPTGRISDLCKRFRCWIACCGGTVVVIDDNVDSPKQEDETKEEDPMDETEKEEHP